MAQHLTLSELNAGLREIRDSPKDFGVLQGIVIRPATNERVRLEECEISPALGVHGDNWAQRCWLSLPSGQPHPDVQVTIMNSRVIALLAQDPNRWAQAGDNFYVDLELSDENLPCGSRLGVGSAILEVTAEPHTGCKKFADRFGRDAVKFVNSSEGKKLHLRGIYARIVQAGTVRTGDLVRKM